MGVPYAEVIGDPIAHSKSPLIHKFWLRKLGIDGDYRAVRVEPGRLHDHLFERRRDPDWRGCNVTAPLKEAVMPFLAWLSPTAEKCVAANTIVPAGQPQLRGHNTDALAVTRLLGSRKTHAYPNQVATYVQIIGGGGAARAATIGAAAAHYCDFEFYNRTLSKAQALAVWFSLAPDGYASTLEGLGPIRNPGDGPEDQRYSHVVINASSLGTDGRPDVPIELAEYYPDTIVLDMAYGPTETRLVRRARELGLRTIDGFDMLVEQAADAFELFFGQPPPRLFDPELRELLTR